MYAALSLVFIVSGFAMLGCVADMCREREAFKEGI